MAERLTRWIEFEPVADKQSVKVARIIMREILVRYGVPYAICSDQGIEGGNSLNTFRHFVSNMG